MNLKHWDSSMIPLRRQNVNSIGPKPYNANHNSSCSSKTTAVFKKIKKRFLSSNLYHLPASPYEPWRWGRENTYIGPCGLLVFCRFVFVFSFKPGAKSLSSSGEKQRWWQQEGWARLVGPRRAGFSGLEATEGGLLPLRCLMTGSGFICLSFSQRGWWADQLVSLDGETWFALRPLSMQGTLWVSVPRKWGKGVC